MLHLFKLDTPTRRSRILLVAAAAVVATGATTAGVLADGGAESATPTSATAPLATGASEPTAPVDAPAVAAAPSSAPATAPTTAAPSSAAPAAERTQQPVAKKTTKPAPPSAKTLKHDLQTQINGYYCGPAAARIALTSLGEQPTQDALAADLGTTVNGTNSAADITRVLNAVADTSHYRSRFLSSGSASQAQTEQFRTDLVKSISTGYPIVANTVGSVTDTDGIWHSFPGGHYVTVVGYRDQGRMVRIADPADGTSYWLSVTDMADWMATRGYSY